VDGITSLAIMLQILKAVMKIDTMPLEESMDLHARTLPKQPSQLRR
jgi:hypothetical protein